MTATSLAKAGPGFWGRRDFLARRGLVLDFLRGRESFLAGMRVIFPEGITVKRGRWIYKQDGFGADRAANSFTTEAGMRFAEDGEILGARRFVARLSQEE